MSDRKGVCGHTWATEVYYHCPECFAETYGVRIDWRSEAARWEARALASEHTNTTLTRALEASHRPITVNVTVPSTKDAEIEIDDLKAQVATWKRTAEGYKVERDGARVQRDEARRQREAEVVRLVQRARDLVEALRVILATSPEASASPELYKAIQAARALL